MKQNILHGVIWKQILAFFFPILLGTIFQQLYTMSDAVLVGKIVGKEALSAVGGTPSGIINMIVGFFTGLAAGATVIIAQKYGAQELQQVEKTVHTAILSSIFFAIALSVIGYALSPLLLSWCSVPTELMQTSLVYMRIYIIGMTGNLLYNIGSGILRAVGDSKHPFYYLVISSLLNIVLDLVFLVPLHWGVAGAAWATILSQAISAFLVLNCLANSNDCYQLQFQKLAIDTNSLKDILRIGLPTGLQSMAFSVSNLIVQIGINGFGTDTVAAWSAYAKMDLLSWGTMNAFGVSLSTFVGQNYGAKQYHRVRKSIHQTTWMMLGSVAIIIFVVYFATVPLLSLFTDDKNVLAIGIRMVHYLLPWGVIYVFIEILSSALRAMGDTFIPMMISCVGICLIRSGWILFLLPLHPTIEMLELSYVASWIAADVLFIAYYFYRRPTLLPL